MQLSTRGKDYIVDTLELRSELHVLNEVFTDPKIVKVSKAKLILFEFGKMREIALYAFI